MVGKGDKSCSSHYLRGRGIRPSDANLEVGKWIDPHKGQLNHHTLQTARHCKKIEGGGGQKEKKEKLPPYTPLEGMSTCQEPNGI